jgi:dephospho-CoA kinase
MLRVGLTGGIACGKSIVASLFESRGARLHRADEESRHLMDPGGPAWAAVQGRFGPGIVRTDGTIDRPALSRIVFQDAAARRDLEKIIHPLVIAGLKTAAAPAEAEGSVRIFVSEAALIYETGLEGWFDRIVVVHCDRETQMSRLVARDGISRKEAGLRLAAQLDPEEKARRADYVIDTSGALEETLARAAAVFALLLDESSAPLLNA